MILALAITLVQCAVFWALSPRDLPGRMVATPARHEFINETAAAFQEWLWLMTPGVFLLPSSRDFSGVAWLAEDPSDVAFQPLTVKSQPLPFAPVAASVATADLLPRIDSGPAAHWDLPPAEIPLPSVPPVPLRDKGAVRIASGLESWQLPRDIPVPPPPAGTIPGPALLKIAVDSSGELAAPPVVWETSGNPAADQLARDMVMALKLESERAPPAPEGEETIAWGFIIVEWARQGPPPDPT
jgi:hypothetical protein